MADLHQTGNHFPVKSSWPQSVACVGVIMTLTVAAAVSRPQADDQSSALRSPGDNKRVAYTAGDTRRQVALTT
ncbi:MAG: hypothetical protein ABSB34_13080 [Candidatus Limnocylindrales bacterium]